MKNIKDLAKFVLAALFFGATVALAVFDPVHDDTDIFLANPNITAERPNVLLAIDNSANWTGAFTNEKNAIVQVVSGLTDGFNVGLMIMPETGGGNDNVDGGYLRFAVRQMTVPNKNALATIVANFDVTADKGNNTTHGAMLYESYLYFSGKQSIGSHGKIKTDKDNTTDAVLSTLTGHGLPASDGSTSPAPYYRTPYGDGCARSFIILISNGAAGNNTTEQGQMQTKLAALTGVNPPAQISVTPNGQQSNWSDEMAKFMANADVLATSAGIPNSSSVQNVYTYVVEVDRATTGQGPAWTALMQSTAANGKGKYFGVSSDASGTAIVDALNAIFSEVQAVNSVFASTTLPVSVNVRGTNLNQVYIGVFRPDSAKAPRWLGNLKMYNLALNTANNTVFLADAANGPPPANGNPAENSSTGFISQSAPSFWTTDSTFWAYRDPSQNGPGGQSDKPDGDLVEKGGAAQQLRIAYAAAEASTSPRNLYTCTTGLVGGIAKDCPGATGFALSGTPFNTTNDAISAASLALDTRAVSPLTAYATQPVASITDRIQITSLTNTWITPTGGFQIQSITNAGTSVAVTTLTTAIPKAITSMTGAQQGTITVNLAPDPTNAIYKSGSNYIVTTSTPFSGVVNGTTVLTLNCTSGADAAAINAFTAAQRTVSASGTSGAKYTYTIPGVTGSGKVCTGGTAGGPGVVQGTVITVTMPAAHGYTNSQQITINGATPANMNGTFPISCSPVPTCAAATTFTYVLTSGTAGAGTPGTASGDSSTATATTAAAHGFANGSSVTITGASNAAYNISATISCTPAPGCAGSTTFTYPVASVISANTNSGVYAFQGGGNTNTVTTYSNHGFNHGDTIFISGSDVSAYNGSFTISCPPFVGGSPCTTLNSFTITTATPQPSNTSFLAFASASVGTFVLGYAPNHALSDGEFVVIEGSAPAAGTRQVQSVFSTDYYFYYIDGTLVTPITSSTNTIRSRDNPRAYVTVPNHGYADGQQVRIDGANPAGYNGEPKTIRVCDPLAVSCTNQQNMFSYPLTAALGTNTSTGVTSSIKTTLAKATSVNHGFTNGSTVAIAGATPGAFNGSYVITVTGANTFTYTIGSVQGDATGTVLAGQASGSSPERDNIIRWVRGQDNFQDENLNSSTTDIRASVHGDVLHSRPAVVNYNRFAGSDNDVFVFYGSNEGIFHAIKGGYANPAGFTPATLLPGQEAWGFVAQEFFGSLKRLRNNAPIISSSFKRPYFMDGPIGVHTEDNCCLADSSPGPNGKLGDTGDKVNLYIANRRGGRFLYALDVNDPVNPKFLWKIDNATTGFGELGQSWSQPIVLSNGAGGVTIPLVLFGAGYDEAADDLDPAIVTAVNTSTGAIGTSTVGTVNRTMGRGIYVVNAATGALIWSAGGIGSGATKEVAGMIYAIPSDITVVRNETTGIPNRAYVGDTGGNMWRIDFKKDTSAAAVAANPNNLGLTTVTKLASIANQATAAGRRKFLFPPDVVGQIGFDAVLVGSGDREHPFDSTVTNRFYMFKDRGNDVAPSTGTTTCDPTILEGTIPDAAEACPPVPGPIPGLSDLTSNCIQDSGGCLAGETQAGVSTKLGTDRGWFITLGTGEKVVGNAVSIGGTTFFNTNQPSATAGGGACGSNLGIARQYQVASADATATADLNAVGGLTGADRSLVHAGGGYLPSPVHVVVMLGGKPVEAVISGVQVSTPPGATLSARLRKFWYKEVDPK